MSSLSKPRVANRMPCPRCRAGGADRSGDNLVCYTDGSRHCYACGKHDFADSWGRVEQLAKQETEPVKYENGTELSFPVDYTPLLDAIWAKDGVQWVKRYGFTDDEIVRNKLGWSVVHNMLIFPVFVENKLIMWQGRKFPKGDPKYITYGPKSTVMDLVGKATSETLVVCEGKLDAMKVGRGYQAMPLYGTDMAIGLIRSVADRFSELGIWLDQDKRLEAVKLACRASQYIPTFVVESVGDPKEYGLTVIENLVERARQTTMYRDEVEEYTPEGKQATLELSYPPRSPAEEEAMRVAVEKARAAGSAIAAEASIVSRVRAAGTTVPAPTTQSIKYSDPFADTRLEEDEKLYGVSPKAGKGFPGCPAGSSCFSLDGTECSHCREVDPQDQKASMKAEAATDNGKPEDYGRSRFVNDWEGDPTLERPKWPFEPLAFKWPHEEHDWGGYNKDNGGS